MKFPNLTAASALTGAEIVPLTQGGLDRRTTAQDIADLAIPAGGTAGQVLAKVDGTDYNTEWVSDGGAVTSVNGATGAVVLDAGDIGIADAGGYFTGTDVEAALQELGASGVGGGGVANEYGTATISSGAIDLSDETVAVWLVTLNANITSITYPTALSGEVLSPVVIFTQDGTGGRTVTGWPTTTWESGSAPTINSAAGSVTSVPLLVLGNGTVYGVS